MPDWQAKAIEPFPEFEEHIYDNQLGPSGLWIDLYAALVSAYDEQPINEDLIGRIYDFAGWCFAQPGTKDIETDVSNAAAVGLFENVPLDKRVSEDLYRWISTETFEGCKNLFRYLLSEEEYSAFSSQFREKKKTSKGTPRF
jgi:hypothetical protein